MSRHRAPQRHPWPVKPTRDQRARQQLARAAAAITGGLPAPLLPWLALLGYCGWSVYRAVTLANLDFVYSTVLVTLIVFAAVLNLWVAHADTWETR